MSCLDHTVSSSLAFPLGFFPHNFTLTGPLVCDNVLTMKINKSDVLLLCQIIFLQWYKFIVCVVYDNPNNAQHSPHILFCNSEICWWIFFSFDYSSWTLCGASLPPCVWELDDVVEGTCSLYCTVHTCVNCFGTFF